MSNNHDNTEFGDILRARGILPPKPPSRSPSPDIPHITQTDVLHAIASTATTSQLDSLLEADNLDSDDERMFEDYRRKRVEEMRKESRRGRFGSMEPLAREDFVREVTEGSKVSLDGDSVENEDVDEDEGVQKGSRKLRGTGVVVFLFKDSVPLSQHLRPLLTKLAKAHPTSKFLSIPAGSCIPNYPDKNVPTLLIYRHGEITGNVVAGAGLNGMRTTVSDLEGLLVRFKGLEGFSSELRAASRAEGSDDESQSEGEGGVGMVGSGRGGVRQGTNGGAKGRNTRDDSDSDYDI